MIRAPVGSLDDCVEGCFELVGKALGGHTSRDGLLSHIGPRRQRLTCANDVVAGGVAGDGTVNLLDDVAARPEFAKGLLPPVRQAPRIAREALGEPHLLQVLEPGEERGLVDEARAFARSGFHLLVDRATLEFAIKRREAVLGHFVDVPAANVEFVAGPKLLGRDLLRSPAHAFRNVPAVKSHLSAVTVDAAHDDVRVGMLGVVVVRLPPIRAGDPSRARRAP